MPSQKYLCSILLLICCLAAAAGAAALDARTADMVGGMLKKKEMSAAGDDLSAAIAAVSAAFLGTAYQPHTLIGSPTTREVLVANFRGVDCLTFLTYVAALSLSADRDAFVENLVRIGYVEATVDFYKRRHFFSDWFARRPQNADDITDTLGGQHITVKKTLNKKQDGTECIPGLGAIPRDITYIPRNNINRDVLAALPQGALVGVYSPHAWLDVSHVGIVIKDKGQVYFRHAASQPECRKVVDTPFMEYFKTRPGIVVLRLRNR